MVPGTSVAQENWQVSGTMSAPAIDTFQLYELDPTTGEYQLLGTIPLDSEGRFSWKGNWSEPNLFKLQAGEDHVVTLAIDRPENVSVELVKEMDGSWRTSVKGSPGTTWLRSFPQKLQELLGYHFGELKIQMEEAVAKKQEARIADLEEQVAQQFPRFTADLKELAVDSLGTTAAMYELWDYIDPNKGLDILDAIVAQFQEEYPFWSITRALSRKLSDIKGLGPGVPAPDFQLPDRQGKIRTLSDYRGQYVYVDFWASWCLACRAENPKLVKLYQTFAGERFTMLGVGIKDEESAWSMAIENDNLPWPQMLDEDNRVAEQYFIQSLPQNVLIDPEGTILARNVRAAQLAEFLKDLL